MPLCSNILDVTQNEPQSGTYEYSVTYPAVWIIAVIYSMQEYPLGTAVIVLLAYFA